jgi:O-antigen ligase
MIKTDFTYSVTLALIAAGVLLLPCVDVRLVRYQILSYALIMGLGWWIGRVSIAAGALIIYLGFACAIHSSTPILMTLSVILYSILLIFVLHRGTDRQSIYNAICAVAIVNVAFQVIQLLGVSNFRSYLSGNHHLIGLQAQVNEISALMAICLPAFFRRGWIYLLPVPLAGLAMAESLVGVMAAGGVGMAYLLSLSRFGWARSGRGPFWLRAWAARPILPLAAGLILSGAIGYAVLVDRFSWEAQKSGRLAVWVESLSIVVQKPLLGWGFGQYSAVVPLLTAPKLMPQEVKKGLYEAVEDKKAFGETARRISGGNPEFFLNKDHPKEVYIEAHNEYLEVLFAAGIPGLAFLLFAIGSVLKRGWGQTDKIPLYGFLASCLAALVFFPWQIVPIAAPTVAWAGLSLRKEIS